MAHHHIIAFIIAVAVAIVVTHSPQLQSDIKSIANILTTAVTQIEHNIQRR